jgi:DNA-binding NtrC family response regulator
MTEQVKILFIDDDPALVTEMRSYFESTKTVTVLVAPNAVEAFKVMQDHAPVAVVVCNVRMPDADGIDFLYKVRKIWPNSRRIIMSSVVETDTMVRMINKARVFHFIRKPCPP